MKTVLLTLTFITAFSAPKVRAQDGTLPINKIQVIGSHNSYRQAIEPELLQLLKAKDTANRLQYLEYDHIPIADQLTMGLRNLEIDIYADSKGGRYAKPKGLELAKLAPYDLAGEMLLPGFKVFHMPDIDFRSSTLTFKSCLQLLKKWSDANPGHMPVFITLEPKDGGKSTYGTIPENFTAVLFDEMDAVIKAGLGVEKLMTPDDVRGKHDTLEEAVLTGNWPSLKESRGKFIFVLDNNGATRDLYIKDHPSLKGRSAFVNAAPGTDEAAILFRNNPEDPSIPGLVEKGYLIRTRADANTVEARKNDYSQFEAAKKSGAQIITTDYYLPSTLFKSTYQVRFDDGTFVRPNPVNGSK